MTDTTDKDLFRSLKQEDRGLLACAFVMLLEELNKDDVGGIFDGGASIRVRDAVERCTVRMLNE